MFLFFFPAFAILLVRLYKGNMLRVVFLTVDGHEGRRTNNLLEDQGFGSAPKALLQGFTFFPSKIRIFIVSCLKTMPGKNFCPQRLAKNIIYIPIGLPGWCFLRLLHFGPWLAIRHMKLRISPDLIHAQGTERWCGLASIFQGVPFVLTVHGYIKFINKISALRPRTYWIAQQFLEALVISFCRNFIAISPFVKKLMPPRASRFLIPNAVGLNFYKPKVLNKFYANPLEFPQKIPVILIIGTIYPIKQQKEFLEAIYKFWPCAQRIELCFIGSTDLKFQYVKDFYFLLKHAPVHIKVSHFNCLSQKSLIKLLDSCSCLVHTSSSETFCLAIAEALVRGIKVFAFDVGGIAYASKSFKQISLFPLNDWSSFIFALHRWISNSKNQSYDKRVVPSYGSARLHPRRVARRHLTVYGKILRNYRKDLFF